ncbi:hypothetical protein PMAYCL1PPCAC_05655, partial [Pristionchus mayeri]
FNPFLLTNLTESEQCAALVQSTAKHKAHAIFVYAQMLYVIPSMMFIKFLLVALICGKYSKSRYASIFYTLIAMAAWTAVLSHLPRAVFEFIAKKPAWFCPTFKALSQPNWWLDIYVYVLQVWDTLRALAATLIVLYRFHSFLDVHAAKRLWEHHKTLIILATIALPMVLFAPIWLTPSKAVIEDAEMVFENEGVRWFNKEAMHCLICTLCAILVLASEAYLILTDKHVNDEVDHALDIVGKVEIIVITIYAFFQVVPFFTRHLVPTRFHYSSLLVSDALGFAPLWALYLISTHIREDATPFRHLFAKCCKCCRMKADRPPKEVEAESEHQKSISMI